MSLEDMIIEIGGRIGLKSEELENTVDTRRETPLMIASKHGDIEIVRSLIEKGANVRAVDNDGWEALTFAASNGNTDILKFLIECGADVNCADDKGRTPLMMSYDTNTETVKALVEAGAYLDARDKNGTTALTYALKGKDKDMALILIEAVADVN